MVVARPIRCRGALLAVLAAATAACSAGGADPFATTTTARTDAAAVESVPPTSVGATTAPAPPRATPATTAAAPITTAASTNADAGELGALDAALAPDGTIDLDAALGLVAAGYAPLPGVTPTPAAPTDGGPALRAVVASAADLTPEQQTAVAAIVAPAGVPLGDAAASTSPVTASAAAAVARALATFGWTAEQVPVAIVELPFDNGDGTRSFSSKGAVATGVVVRADDRDECRLRVDRDAPADAAFLAAIARETYHCGQFLLLGAGPASPAWVLEGAAAHAADRVAGPTPATAAAWQRWVGQPQRPLTARTADAVGFFALVADTADGFAFAAALLGDPTVDSVRRRLELTDLFDRWGREYATDPAWEGGFAFRAPGAAGLRAPRSSITLALDGPAVRIGGRDDLSATPYAVTVPGDVLVVTTTAGDRGAIRFANGQAEPLSQATQSVCLLPRGCACPGVPPDALDIGEAGGADVFVGVGPSSGSGPTLAARSLARWCQEVAVPPPADAVDPCLVGTWRTASYVAPEVPGVAQRVSGGEGGTITFRADRTVRIDLTAMSPVVIESSAATGTGSTTTLAYRGAGTGTWRADGGVVEVAGVDPSSFGIRVRVESADGSPLGAADLAATDVRGATYATVLGTARYACTPVSLSLTHVLPGIGAVGGLELSPT